MDFDKELRIMLAEANMSQADLARKLGVSPQNFNNKLKRNVKLKDVESMLKIFGRELKIVKKEGN